MQEHCEFEGSSLQMLLAAACNNDLELVNFLLQKKVQFPQGTAYTLSCLQTATSKCSLARGNSNETVLEPWQAAASCAAAVLTAVLFGHSQSPPVSKTERNLLGAVEEIIGFAGIDVLAQGMPSDKLVALVAELLHASPSRAHILQALRMSKSLLESNIRIAHALVRNGTAAALETLKSRAETKATTLSRTFSGRTPVSSTNLL